MFDDYFAGSAWFDRMVGQRTFRIQLFILSALQTPTMHFSLKIKEKWKKGRLLLLPTIPGLETSIFYEKKLYTYFIRVSEFDKTWFMWNFEVKLWRHEPITLTSDILQSNFAMKKIWNWICLAKEVEYKTFSFFQITNVGVVVSLHHRNH